MTRIQPKAPPIQQLPRRDRPSSDAAGTDFHEFLKARPEVERRETTPSPQQRETHPSDRDSMPDPTPYRNEWDRPPVLQDRDKALVDAGRAMNPSAYATASSFVASPLPQAFKPAQDVLPAQTPEPAAPLVVEPLDALQGEPDTRNDGAIAVPLHAEHAALAAEDQGKPLSGGVSAEPRLQATPGDEAGAVVPQALDPADAVTAVEIADASRDAAVLAQRRNPPIEIPESTGLDQAVVTAEKGNLPQTPTAAARPHAPDPVPPGKATPLVLEASPPHVQEPVLVQTRIGQESQDWFIRPWRLQANAGLSFRSDRPSAAAAPASATLLAGAMPRAEHMHAAAAGVAAFDEGSLPARWKNLLRLPVHVESASARMEADGIDASDPAAAKSGEVAAWLHWSQRMLRWNGNAAGAGGVTAWVRDYSLDASEIPALVRSLAALSAEQGFLLERVMVNGHEAWAATGYVHLRGGDNDGR